MAAAEVGALTRFTSKSDLSGQVSWVKSGPKIIQTWWIQSVTFYNFRTLEDEEIDMKWS